MSGPDSILSLDVSILDSLLIKVLGGDEGDSLAALFGTQTKSTLFDRIEDNAVSKKVKFVAHKPRQPGGTAICTGLDGNVYDADDENIPAIPQHFGCRSQYQFFDGVVSAR